MILTKSKTYPHSILPMFHLLLLKFSFTWKLMDFSVINVCIIYISLLFFTYMSNDAYISIYLYVSHYVWVFFVSRVWCFPCQLTLYISSVNKIWPCIIQRAKYLVNSCVPLVRIKSKGFVIKIDNVLQWCMYISTIWSLSCL